LNDLDRSSGHAHFENAEIFLWLFLGPLRPKFEPHHRRHGNPEIFRERAIWWPLGASGVVGSGRISGPDFGGVEASISSGGLGFLLMPLVAQLLFGHDWQVIYRKAVIHNHSLFGSEVAKPVVDSNITERSYKSMI
jgi:hypothetical protein